VNDVIFHVGQQDLPFGGVKKSGIGVEFAQEGLEEYTDIQVVFS
jgi:acyl-CoA reductase-like NAD-dependent aldehyde dehydrogenase